MPQAKGMLPELIDFLDFQNGLLPQLDAKSEHVAIGPFMQSGAMLKSAGEILTDLERELAIRF